MIKKIKIKDIRTNPFQTLDEWDEDVIEKLRRSKFYGGLVGRKKNGTIELAYGHHRLEAAIRNGETHLHIDIKDLTNEEMFDSLSKENTDRRIESIKETQNRFILAGKVLKMNGARPSHENIAKFCNSDKNHVQRVLSIPADIIKKINKMPQEIKKGEISFLVARHLARITNKRERQKITKMYGNENTHGGKFAKAITTYLNTTDKNKKLVLENKLSIYDIYIPKQVIRAKIDDSFKTNDVLNSFDDACSDIVLVLDNLDKFNKSQQRYIYSQLKKLTEVDKYENKIVD